MLRRALSRPAAPLLALTAFAGLVAAYLIAFGYDTARFTTEDEIWAIHNGRLLERDLGGMILDTQLLDRGPERLMSLLIAAVGSLTDGVAAHFHVLHVIVPLVYVAAGFFLYALGRRLGLGPWTAAAAAALGIVGPWMIFGATFLNTALGFPITMAFAWAVHRAATEPSWRNDLLVLGIAALNMLARTSHVAFAGAAVLAVFYATWRRRPLGEATGRSLLLLVPRVIRAHPLIMAAVALVLLYVAVRGPAALAGAAYDRGEPADLDFPVADILDRGEHWFSQFFLASGVIPFVIGGAWALREVVKPQETSTGVFAVTWIGLILVFVYITGSHNSTIEERYIAPLGGLPALAFVVAVARRRIWMPGVVLMLGLGVWSALEKAFFQPATPFDYLTAPARMAFHQAGVGQASVLLPIDRSAIPELLMALAAVVTIAVALYLRRRTDMVRAALVVAVPLIVGSFAVGVWATQKYKPVTFPERSIAGNAFLDRIAGDETVFLWRYSWAENEGLRYYYANLAFTFNEQVCCNIWVNDVPLLLGENGELPPPPPGERYGYLARLAGFHPAGFHTEEVERSRYYGQKPTGEDDLRVERFIGPPRAAFVIEGTGPAGEVAAGGKATLRLFEWAQRDGFCVSVQARTRGGRPYELRAGGRSVPARPGRAAQIPVRGAATVTVHAPRGTPLRVGETALVRCG